MPALTASQTAVLRELFSAVPDAAVTDLERALADSPGPGPMAQVRGLVTQEAADRRIRAAVFAPLMGLCRPGDSPTQRFPVQTPALLWSGLRNIDPETTEAVAYCLARPDYDYDSTEELETAKHACKAQCDELCATAAQGLRGEVEAFELARRLLEADRPGGAAAFASQLDLAPLARRAVDALPDWISRMSNEKAAAVRLAYKDAVAISVDAGPNLFEILFANLAQPWQIVRLLAAVMGHPGERYLAVSELAQFGQRILDDIDAKLEAFQAFDPDKGKHAGLAAAEILRLAATQIAEFEDSIELNRQDGVWGKRVSKQRQSLARLAELKLGQIDKALDAALPLQRVKFGKGVRAHPRLDVDPDPAALRRAEGLMAFFDASRQYAGNSGFGSARAKVAEMMEGRLDQYVEDLLELLRAGEIDCMDRVRIYLGLAAEMVEAAQGVKAGDIVRRRAAA